jgi:hypothetical protein
VYIEEENRKRLEKQQEMEIAEAIKLSQPQLSDKNKILN